MVALMVLLGMANDWLDGGPAFEAAFGTLGDTTGDMNLGRAVLVVTAIALVDEGVLGRGAGESVPLHRGCTAMVWQLRITGAEGKLCTDVTSNPAGAGWMR